MEPIIKLAETAQRTAQETRHCGRRLKVCRQSNLSERSALNLNRGRVPQAFALDERKMGVHQEQEPVQACGSAFVCTHGGGHNSERVSDHLAPRQLTLGMLLRIPERVEQLRAVILQIYVPQVFGLRCQSVHFDEARVKANVKTLNAVEGHLRDFQTLDPDEGFAAADSQKYAGLDCACVAECFKKGEAVDGVPVARQVVCFEEGGGALDVKATEIDIGVGHLLQGQICIVPNLKAVLASFKCSEETPRATDLSLTDLTSEVGHLLHSLIVELLLITSSIFQTLELISRSLFR